MSKKSNYITTNRSKHYLKIHLIFVCKYRKPLLIGNLNEDMKTILENITNNSDFNIEVMESQLSSLNSNLCKFFPKKYSIFCTKFFSITNIKSKIFGCKVFLIPPYIPQTKDLWVFRWSYIKKTSEF